MQQTICIFIIQNILTFHAYFLTVHDRGDAYCTNSGMAM